MTYANPTERQEFTSGLRELADFLENNPEVPSPKYTDVLVFPPHASDAQNRSEIEAIAERIGVKPREAAGGHYVAVRCFGPVEYRAVAIPHDNTDGE